MELDQEMMILGWKYVTSVGLFYVLARTSNYYKLFLHLASLFIIYVRGNSRISEMKNHVSQSVSVCFGHLVIH